MIDDKGIPFEITFILGVDGGGKRGRAIVINKAVLANESVVVAGALQLAVPVSLGLFCDALADEKFATFAEAVMNVKQGTKLIPLFIAELGVTVAVEEWASTAKRPSINEAHSSRQRRE